MSEQSTILLEANDCCAFKNQEGYSEAIQYFISNASEWSIFHFNSPSGDKEIPEIAFFNYQDAKWYAGRLVGEATFNYNGQQFEIKIKPRFGLLQLFRMFEEVFNVRFSESKKSLTRHDNIQFLIKKMISFLWLNMLAKANKHGLPRHNVTKSYKGTNIRGSLNIRRSIIPLYLEKQLVSDYKEKAVDDLIANILNQAYNLLLQEYHLGTLNIPYNAIDAIEQLKSSDINKNHVSEREYRKIIYKEVYLSFKPIVDLSWDIIQKGNIGNQHNHINKKSFSFFIDMAEIWESYLKSLLTKSFIKEGWKLRKDKLVAYKQKDFQRTLIPDIVLEKNNNLMVWDAKYKHMKFDYFDYDRADFFQIHTYINYYLQSKTVIAGGLLYPLTKQFDLERQKLNQSESLFGAESNLTKYIVDGICFSEMKNEELTAEQIKTEEYLFISRISSLINI